MVVMLLSLLLLCYHYYCYAIIIIITNIFIIKKDVFSLVTSVGQKKIPRPLQESNLRPSDSALRCSTTEPLNQCRSVMSVDRNRRDGKF